MKVTAYQKISLAIVATGVIVVAFSLNRPTVIAAAPAAAVGNSPTGGYGITTYGDATIKVKPDIAVLNLGMSADSTTAADAQAQVAARVAHVLAAAKVLGIADADVKTWGYNLGPNYKSNSYPNISGYSASEQLSFTLRDVTRVGKALDALAGDSGATSATIQFALGDRKPAEADARTQAVGVARAKADAMAKAGGVRVGQLLSISDQPSGYVGPVPYAAAASAASATVIPVGDLDVVVRVEVQFSIA
jgi:uncharacterized protein YggE